MKEELETLVTQVKALLTECLQGWLQALSQGDSVDDPASLGQLAVQLSTAYSTLQAAAAAYPGDTGGSAQAPSADGTQQYWKPRHDTPRTARLSQRSPRMSISEELGRNLVQLAQLWLKRPLTSEEHEQLRQFQLGLGNDASSDPAVHARQQAEQVIENGRQRSEGSIRQILQNVQQASTQALRAQDSGEQAILEAVNAAGSLAELRPGHLQSGQASANQLVMSQIADRLANLVKSEVRLCFEQNFGSLKQQLENAIAIFNQSNHNTSAPPPDKPDPPTA
ncbi:hypothetical protein P7I89_11035 [Pseudomonas aeruginosa]|nr:hypothetical protein P7I89_11035 [Pseudomonas aeruginosa]